MDVLTGQLYQYGIASKVLTILYRMHVLQNLKSILSYYERF